MKTHRVSNLYKLEGRTKINHATITSNATNSTLLWNQHLCHMIERGMKVLVDRKLLPSLKSVNLSIAFMLNKLHRNLNLETYTSKGILDYIHSNLWVPYPKIS